MKKLLSLILCLVLALSLVACGGGGQTENSDTAGSNTASGTEKNTDASTEGGSEKEEWQPKTEVQNLVLACDQYNHRLVVYDLEKALENDGDLDEAEVWVFENHNTAGMKYREDTVYGDVVVSCAYSEGGPQIISYDTKEVLWTGGTGKAGTNPHSIEILPSGNIVTASSTDGVVRIFNSYACVNDGASVKFTSYDLPGAHGVLWDPEYDVLWAVGDDDLVAYQVIKGDDNTETLRQIGGMGGTLPYAGGHDLSADMNDTRYLWITSSQVFKFDKEENEFVEKYDQSAKLNKSSVKGFGNNKNGNYIFCIPNGGEGRPWEDDSISDWCTDTIYYGYWKSEYFLYVQELVSEKSAFYKVMAFYGQYQ